MGILDQISSVDLSRKFSGEAPVIPAPQKIQPPPKILKLPPVGVSSSIPPAAPVAPPPPSEEIPAAANGHTEHAGSSGFQILAVYDPEAVDANSNTNQASGWAFAPTTTQAQRREIIEDAEWWDRRDARALKAKAEAEADAETEAVCGNIPE